MARSTLLPAERHQMIITLLSQKSTLEVPELAGRLGASESTVRRDLGFLEKSGLLERTRGGAVIARSRVQESSFAARQRQNPGAKAAIGRTAAALVQSRDDLFLNDGSTTLQMAEWLSKSDKELWVATTAINIAEVLVSNERFTVLLLGGFLRATSYATWGPFVETMLQSLHARCAFLGVDAMHSEFGCSINNTHDSMVARMLAERADEVSILADSSKWGHQARTRAVGWGRVRRLITDTGLPAEARKALERQGVEVVCVAPDA